MTPHPHQLSIAPGELVYSDHQWKVFRQDIGMGDVEYAMFLKDEWFAMVPDNYHWNLIIGIVVSHSSVQSEQMLTFIQWIESKQEEMHDIMRRNGLVLDNLDDPMQKWAFTFYSEVAEMSNKASQLLEELRSKGGEQP